MTGFEACETCGDRPCEHYLQVLDAMDVEIQGAVAERDEMRALARDILAELDRYSGEEGPEPQGWQALLERATNLGIEVP